MLICGCSRQITGEPVLSLRTLRIYEGYVTFGGGAKGGKKLLVWNLKDASKEETSGILKNFINEIENLVDKKVKIIRCDNGTEFKNRVISEFCEQKGIKREFSIARTPQQNGKFDGKSDEGFFVGYSLNSKAFRVYNIRTTKVEENLHIRFLEDKPIIAGDGPKWLFDIDVLTKSMNYVPVVAGTNSNDLVDGLLFDSSLKNASNDEPQPSSDAEKKDDEGVCKESGIAYQEKSKNSTQGVNTDGPSINTKPNMFSLGDNDTLEATHVDFFSGETEVDMSNITTAYPVLSTLNTRIHKDHSLNHVIVRAQKGNPSIKRSKLDRSYAIRASTVQVTTGYHSEEGIDYDEVFAPIARIEAIRLFLAYASFKDFVVYQMDVKSAFLYGKIEEEVYVCQPLGFEDPEFLDRVYKNLCTELETLMHKKFQMSSMGELTFFLGLQVTQKDDGIFISQDKYVDEILKKFGFSTMKTASTPIETSKPLLKDAEVEDVDVHLYRSMIGSLMYLTSSRPDIMFAVCACARFQVTPKVSHLHAVKRIFRYLKGQPKLGLWYPKDSPFDLEAYSDSDYAGASLDRKSTIGAANDDIQVSAVGLTLYWNNLLLLGIKQFWATAKAKIINREVQIQALVDGKKLTLIGAKTTAWNEFSSTMASAVICLATNQKFNFSKYIFDNMVKNLEGGVKFLMYPRFVQVFLDKQVEGMTKHKEIYVTPSHTKKVFANMKRGGKGFSRRVTPLFQTMMVQAPEELGEGSEIPTDPQHTPTIIQPSTSQPQKKQPRRKQRKDTEVPQPSGSTEPITDEAANAEHVPTHSNDPLFSGEDRLQLKELLELCTKLSERVLDLENTKTSQAADITKLKERVKKLERRNKSRTPWLKRLRKVGIYAKVVSSKYEGLGAQEDASKQGRKIADLDADAKVTLVDEAQGRNDDYLMFDTRVFDEQEVEVEKVVSIAEVTTVSATTTTVDKLTLAQTLIEIKAAKPRAVTTTSTTTTTVAKDKGKAKMIEPKKPLKKKDQILIDEEITQKLQAQLNAKLEEEEKLAKQREEDVNTTEWDNVQAMINADYELASRLHAQEQEELIVEEKLKLFVELIDKRKKHFARLIT
ncbi:retrovirus-related pol polyprotein from transposon TNT 1-94 [Tanacetum coccineum]